MREAVFIRQNLKKWYGYEQNISSASDHSPDDLADMYTDLTADLAFAQTHYPNSRVTEYLNGLALSLHNEIYKGRREKLSRFRDFWAKEVPLAVYDSRREMRAALIVFLLFVVIGVVSTLGDSEFSRLILGNGYVDMTLENISQGSPTAVYDDGSGFAMFFEIAWNNLNVGIIAFVLGIFSCIGPGYILFTNGIMVGTFFTLFAQYGVFGPSAVAIMQHGTLELSSTVICAASGFILGNSWMFPGTYSRMQSFLLGAKRGMKILVGDMPLVVLAAIFESFVTRHVDAPIALRLGVIGASAAFIIYYYVVLPGRVHKKLMTNEEK